MMGFARRAAMITLAAVFFLLGAMAVAAGVSAYSRTAEMSEQTGTMRTAQAFISNQMRRADFSGGIEVASVDDICLLILNEPQFTDEEGNIYRYCTYIYALGGFLRELYTEKGFEPDFETGTAIMPLDAARFSVNERGQVVFELSAGGAAKSAVITPRSAQGGQRP